MLSPMMLYEKRKINQTTVGGSLEGNFSTDGARQMMNYERALASPSSKRVFLCLYTEEHLRTWGVNPSADCKCRDNLRKAWQARCRLQCHKWFTPGHQCWCTTATTTTSCQKEMEFFLCCCCMGCGCDKSRMTSGGFSIWFLWRLRQWDASPTIRILETLIENGFWLVDLLDWREFSPSFSPTRDIPICE